MKKMWTRTFIPLSALLTIVSSCSSGSKIRSIASDGRHGHYDGPRSDVDVIGDKPDKYAECDHYLSDNSPKRVFAACEFGRDEAERMAQRYGGGNGRVEGFLRGFSWGLHKMADAYKNDPASVAQGAAVAVNGSMDSYTQAPLQASSDAGASQGTPTGTSDAIQRFKNVVNTGRDPDSTVSIPSVPYAGIDNGYATYVGRYETPQRIIQQDLNEGTLRVYNNWDGMFMGDKKALNAWDIWREDGNYDSDKSQWYDAKAAFQTWLQRPIDSRPRYDSLNNPPLYGSVASSRKGHGARNLAGGPDGGSHTGTGGQGNGKKPSPTPSQAPPQTPPPSTPAQQQIDLQAVFAKAFQDSYAYYVKYYFSAAYYGGLDDGQDDGESLGVDVGKKLAYQSGLIQNFNSTLKTNSINNFQSAFARAYTDNFNRTFQNYSSAPQLNYSFDDIVGEDNVGVLEPGEMFTAKFTVTDYGGVATL